MNLWLSHEWIRSVRRFELDVAGDRVPVRPSLKAPYDPTGARLKA